MLSNVHTPKRQFEYLHSPRRPSVLKYSPPHRRTSNGNQQPSYDAQRRHSPESPTLSTKENQRRSSPTNRNHDQILTLSTKENQLRRSPTKENLPRKFESSNDPSVKPSRSSVVDVTQIQLRTEQTVIVNVMVRKLCRRANSSCLLYHHMGVGKTLLALAIVANMASAIDRVLIVCPSHLKFVWKAEFDKWHFPLKRSSKVISFDQFATDRSKYKHTAIILDEVQLIFKNDTVTQSSLILSKIATARTRIMLSGTPCDDLETYMMLMKALRPERFPSSTDDVMKQYAKVNMTNKVMHQVKYFLPSIEYISSFLTAYIFRSLPSRIGVYVFFKLAMKYVENVGSTTYMDWDIPKISEDTSNIVSYVGDPSLGSEASSFPVRLPDRTIPVFLTDYQVAAFQKWLNGTLSKYEQISFEIAEDSDKLNYITSKRKNSPEAIADRGRALGMVMEEATLDIPKKVYHIISLFNLIKKSETYLGVKYSECKFMVYTDFLGRAGLAGVIGYFKRAKIPYAFVSSKHSEDANKSQVAQYNASRAMILVNHGISEGMSLKGTRIVFLLEPPLKSSSFEQIVGRARRADSHIHLSKSEQTVSVHVLVSRLREDNAIKKGAASILNVIASQNESMAFTEFSFSASKLATGLLPNCLVNKNVEHPSTAGMPLHDWKLAGDRLHKSDFGTDESTGSRVRALQMRLLSSVIMPKKTWADFQRFIRGGALADDVHISKLKDGQSATQQDLSSTPDEIANQNLGVTGAHLRELETYLTRKSLQDIGVRDRLRYEKCNSSCMLWPVHSQVDETSCALSKAVGEPENHGHQSVNS